MVKLPMRNKSVGTKVTDAEFATLEAQAQARKLTVSEWVRTELLSSRGGEMETGTGVLLGELLALRTILINLLFSLSNGEPVTPEAMKDLIERADSDKDRRAMERLTAVWVAVPATATEIEAGEAV